MVLTLNNVLEAMKGTRISNRPQDEIKAGMETIMRDISILAGSDPDLIFPQLEDLAKDMASGFPMLTLEEIRLAGKAGAAGELGGPKRPSYAAMMQWVDAYHHSAMVADGRKIHKKEKAEVKKISLEEGWRIFVSQMPQALKRRWEDIRTQGKFGKAAIPHVSAQLYDWLGEEGVLHLTDEQRNQATRKGRSEVESCSVWEIGTLESGKALIRSRVKHYALELWMQDLYHKGQTPTIPTKIQRLYD